MWVFKATGFLSYSENLLLKLSKRVDTKEVDKKEASNHLALRICCIQQAVSCSDLKLTIFTGKKHPQVKLLTKNTNMDICVVGTSNQLFLRGAKTEASFPKK